jgi:hypothetical protein
MTTFDEFLPIFAENVIHYTLPSTFLPHSYQFNRYVYFLISSYLLLQNYVYVHWQQKILYNIHGKEKKSMPTFSVSKECPCIQNILTWLIMIPDLIYLPPFFEVLLQLIRFIFKKSLF